MDYDEDDGGPTELNGDVPGNYFGGLNKIINRLPLHKNEINYIEIFGNTNTPSDIKINSFICLYIEEYSYTALEDHFSNRSINH